MERANAMQKKIVELLNKRDAAGYAALYTADGVVIGPDGSLATGHAAIEASEVAALKAWGDAKFATVTKEARAIGNGVIWTVLDSTIDGKGPNGPIALHSHVLNMYVLDGKDWKIAVSSIGLNPARPAQR